MRKSLLPILALTIFLAVSPAIRAQDPDGWVRTYHGGTGDGLEDPVGIAVDVEGAVYVAGNSGRGTITVKYDAVGTLLWSSHSEGEAVAMRLDSTGNLLVARTVLVHGVVVRYDPDGSETEVARLAGERLLAMAIDPADQLVVVSHASASSALEVTKYDRSFARLWSKSVVVAPDAWGTVLGLVLHVDAEGSPAVSARLRIQGRAGAWIATTTLRLDPDGNTVWRTRDAPVDESFRPYGVTGDGERNLFVAGSVDACDQGLGRGLALVKYDPEGNVLWTRCHESGTVGGTVRASVASDAAGNVYVSGGSAGVPSSYTTLKYDPDGALIWEDEVPGGTPIAMAVDPGGAVIVTGRDESCRGAADCLTTYRTVKYDPGGREAWTRWWEDPPESQASASAVTLDPAGGVYVAGTASKDYGVVSYDADGTERWRAVHNTPIEREDEPIGIAVTEDDTVYAAGISCDPEGCDTATLRVGATGDVIWEKRIEDVTATAMTLDRAGQVHVTGWSWASERPPVRQSVTVKYGAAGDVIWSSSGGDFLPVAIGTDLEGNVYVGGRQARSRVLVKYDSDGDELWASPSGGGDFTAMEVDPEGFVFVAERLCARGACYAVVLLDQDGDEIWRAPYGGAGTEGRLYDLTLDSRGNIYATGYVRTCNPGCETSQLTVKYGADGEEEWSRSISAGENERFRSSVVKADADDSVYVSVGASGLLPYELITAKYAPDGTELWRRSAEGLRSPVAIDVDATGHVFIHGDGTTVRYDPDGNLVSTMRLPGDGRRSRSFLAVGPERIHIAGTLDRDVLIITDLGEAFHLEPDGGHPPLDVTVRAPEWTLAAGAGVTTHLWDFGDGGTAIGESASHRYSEAGSFALELSSSNAVIETRKIRRVNAACPGGDVAPWISADIGSIVFEGATRIEAAGGTESVHICTGGRGIVGNEDGFHFLYQEHDGDVVLTARVSDLAADAASRVGVMLRESLEPDAPHAFMLFDQTTISTFQFLYRERTRARIEGSGGGRVDVPEAWLRIRRQGDRFIGYRSTDGTEWIEMARVVLDLPRKLFVGLAASSRYLTGRPVVRPISVVLDHIELDLDPTPLERPFQRGDASADGDVNLTDATVILGALFAGQADAVTCEKAGDTNDSGALEISDSVYLLAHLFGAGAAPAAPFGACGVDPTADSLTCTSHEACE